MRQVIEDLKTKQQLDKETQKKLDGAVERIKEEIEASAKVSAKTSTRYTSSQSEFSPRVLSPSMLAAVKRLAELLSKQN